LSFDSVSAVAGSGIHRSIRAPTLGALKIAETNGSRLVMLAPVSTVEYAIDTLYTRID
jgi:hypothetical protein